MLTYFGFTYLKEPKSTKGAQPDKVAAAVGNAPTYQVLQTRANLSQLSSEIGQRGLEPPVIPAPKAGAMATRRLPVKMVPPHGTAPCSVPYQRTVLLLN